jgi:hypothetical protein
LLHSKEYCLDRIRLQALPGGVLVVLDEKAKNLQGFSFFRAGIGIENQEPLDLRESLLKLRLSI